MEARLLNSLEPDVRAALRAQAERDLARRTVFGAMVYFIMVVIVAWGTAYYPEHPGTILFAGTLTFSLGAGRLGCALRMRNETGPALFCWAGPLRRFTEAQLAAWGVFAWWTLELYGFSPVSLMVLLSTAAFAGGITSSLSPDLGLGRRGLVLVMAPPTIWGSFQDTREGWVLVLFGSIYLIFLLAQVREHYEAYWTTSVSAARAAALERDRLFRVAFETANAGMALIDADGRFRRVNLRICIIFGRTEDELLSLTLQSLVMDADRRQDWLEGLQIGIAAREVEERFVKSGGEVLWGAVSLAAVGGERPEDLRYYVMMIQDVTARKRAELERNEMEARLQQTQKLEAVGTLAGGVAHDFNNLLAVIMGYVDLAIQDLGDHPVSNDLTEILEAGERAKALVGQLLAFGRRQKLQPEIWNLNQIVSETRELLQRTAGADIQVDLDLDPVIEAVKVDVGQIQQVLLNLVLNSRDAMPEGGHITISTRTASAPTVAEAAGSGTSFVVLSVSDSGCGMADNVKARAFEPFFTTKETGSGLGLASVYGIVKQSGGEIRVESKPREGTLVEILLPRAEAHPRPVPETVSSDREPAPLQHGVSASVLVAEDESAIRKIVETFLRSSGYEVRLYGHFASCSHLPQNEYNIPDFNVLREIAALGVSRAAQTCL